MSRSLSATVIWPRRRSSSRQWTERFEDTPCNDRATLGICARLHDDARGAALEHWGEVTELMPQGPGPDSLIEAARSRQSFESVRAAIANP